MARYPRPRLRGFSNRLRRRALGVAALLRSGEGASIQSFRTHDLLRIGDPYAMGPAPDWALASLASTPWVVVRRVEAPAGSVAVGVRGLSRDERFGSFLPADKVLEVRSPEALRARDDGRGRSHPVLDTLSAIASALDATGLAWGPVGGAGFELATGAPVLRDTSDLDLIVRAEPARDIDALAAFHRAAASGQVRVDVLVETARGAAALAELFAGKDAVVMRTPSGPRLVPTSELGSSTLGK